MNQNDMISRDNLPDVRNKVVASIKVGRERVCLEFAPLLSIDYRFLSARWPRPKTLTQFFVLAYKNIDFTHLLTDLTVEKTNLTLQR